MQNVAGPGVLADCPTRLAVEILGSKWAVLVIFGLRNEPLRHGQIVDVVGGVSRKVLTETLRHLQRYGLIERRAHAPRQVEYGLTDLGRTLVEPIEVLTQWAREHGPSVVEAQEPVG